MSDAQYSQSALVALRLDAIRTEINAQLPRQVREKVELRLQHDSYALQVTAIFVFDDRFNPGKRTSMSCKLPIMYAGAWTPGARIPLELTIPDETIALLCLAV